MICPMTAPTPVSPVWHCMRCDQDKPWSDFYIHKLTGKPGTHCRPCAAARQYEWRQAHPERWAEIQRAGRLAYKYGMTPEQWAEILDAQDGCCACCDEPPDDGQFEVDHDHACCPGKRSCGRCVRGLVCHACNTALAALRDDPDRAIAAAMYLLRRKDVIGAHR